ncbi:ArnT family glycosyltransferase [Cerasicoccus frondis]|uniref:ArnT family glycosyltransferase n=1 Tax=Cerasicoccus frondis TaxID=490090 RepID=UPI0028529DC5|nr:glycosyltransferase family 39 protein [Cerasicoccus frondis]
MSQDQQQDVWKWATYTLWLAMTLILLLTMNDYGMSWDEITRWNSGDLKLDYFERVAEHGMSEWGNDLRGDLYPGLFDLPLAIYAKYTGGDRLLAGHLYIIFFSLLAAIAAAMVARELGGWRLAFWAVLLLMMLPRFYGHCVFNPKDIPFAATYTWGLWGVLYTARTITEKRYSRWVVAGLLAGVAMSTRLPGMIILAYLLGITVYRFASQSMPNDQHSWRLPPPREWIDGIGGLLIASLCAYGVLLCFFPASHHNPFADSARVVGALHTFSDSIPVLFRGEVYDAGSTPWYYAPWMLLMVTPLWQLALLVTGIALAFAQLISMWRRRLWWASEVVPFGVVLVGFGFPLLYLIASQPAIHNGVRHVLFIIPTGAVLMAYGLARLFKLASSKGRLAPLIVTAVVVFCILSNIASLIRLHPYQYVYFNALSGGPSMALGQYETEYWFTSMPEGFRQLQAWREEQGLSGDEVAVMVTGPLEIAEYQLPAGWKVVQTPDSAHYFLGNTQFAGHLIVDGEEIITIERMGLPIMVIKQLQGEVAEH